MLIWFNIGIHKKHWGRIGGQIGLNIVLFEFSLVIIEIFHIWIEKLWQTSPCDPRALFISNISCLSLYIFQLL